MPVTCTTTTVSSPVGTVTTTTTTVCNMSAAARLAAAFEDGGEPPSAEELERAGVYGTVSIIRPNGAEIDWLGKGLVCSGTHLDEPPPDVATYGKQTVWATDGVLLREAAKQRWHKDARQLCHQIGIPDSIINKNEEMTFRLSIYSQADLPAGREIVPATWGGLKRIAEAELPDDAWARLEPHWETIRGTPKEAWESDVEMRKLKHGGRMTVERYVAMGPADDTPAAGRLLLDHRFNAFTEYYTGDGFTQHAVTWSKTPYREYFAPNVPLASIPAAQQVGLSIRKK